MDDTSAQSGKNAATAVPVPKKTKRKRTGSDDDSRLLSLIDKLHAETNARLDTLSARIGYEMDLGKFRQAIFSHLENIPELTESQRYDLCDIIGKENSRLEIFTVLTLRNQAMSCASWRKKHSTRERRHKADALAFGLTG